MASSSSASANNLAPSAPCHVRNNTQHSAMPTTTSREKREIFFTKPHVDILRGAERIELPVLDHGFIALVDCMPRLVPEGSSSDFAIVQAARVSYGVGTKTPSTDTGLVKYLLRHRHTTPFEMVVLKFHIRMPLFVARQWLRHRTASVNEYSARYSILPDLFYTPPPDSVRQQSQTNRQGKVDAEEQGGGCSDDALAFFESYISRQEEQYAMYTTLLEKHNVSREIARIGLPQNIYTEFYWQCNLHNILHFLSLRMDKHAQEEIRQYA